MIYLDTSVALAHLLDEERTPPPGLWQETLVSSRLLEHETRTTLRRLSLIESHGDLLDELLQRLAFLELIAPVLAGVGGAVPAVARTLDAIHLASMLFLREQGVRIRLATYDRRLADGATRLRIPLADELI